MERRHERKGLRDHRRARARAGARVAGRRTAGNVAAGDS
ncbi:hypothetical protein GLE_2956 [Lysobacter enzymogenes]|uniref:Uncharacterized protein n=1 Tax=Lysobacter enzymogenes TaxID=69 RepID=A0A0S2DIJ2_LYSEN|nr:hypothetical protein GLE_2956 [Lysobacter enzymogenes]